MNDLYVKPLKSEKLQSGECYGQFLIDKLKPGQGITIGNQLRRVLLGELGGTAISAVRILGIRHEFATIPGVREDILEILLNIKGIIIKNNTTEVKFGRLKVQGPLVITADLIDLPSGLEIVNPNHYIATISTSINLELEFKIEYGTGYKLASQLFTDEDKNFLQIDSIFMPVQKVNFKIENIYDNNNSLSERLIFEIWTNGSIEPQDALKKACKITIDCFDSLLKTKSPKKIIKKTLNNRTLTIEPYTNIAIEELQLSVRSYNCLKKAKINTVGDLLQYSPDQLQELKNFGRKSADEVFSTLKNKLNIILKKNITNN
uniref:RNA polymerase subunit alpha n=1 Tax=Thalassionema nitzschioides TaxID=33649 RepID=UPI001EDFE4DA|nr:RNA polymerase subunit alpha [Thalassionema nitzschioides]UHY40680.1 RNA polymerase subunit alpha [Thalassionema nitzschioides]